MNKQIPNMQRRTIMMSVAAVPALGLSAAYANDAEMVAETDDLAIQLGYKADATKVDTTTFDKRSGADGSTQFCKSCQFYEAPDQASAPCVVFGGKKVASAGWCNSWFKRAA